MAMGTCSHAHASRHMQPCTCTSAYAAMHMHIGICTHLPIDEQCVREGGWRLGCGFGFGARGWGGGQCERYLPANERYAREEGGGE